MRENMNDWDCISVAAQDTKTEGGEEREKLRLRIREVLKIVKEGDKRHDFLISLSGRIKTKDLTDPQMNYFLSIEKDVIGKHMYHNDCPDLLGDNLWYTGLTILERSDCLF